MASDGTAKDVIIESASNARESHMAKTTEDKEHETWMKALRAEAKPADRDLLINAARANLSPNKFKALLKAWDDVKGKK